MPVAVWVTCPLPSVTRMGSAKSARAAVAAMSVNGSAFQGFMTTSILMRAIPQGVRRGVEPPHGERHGGLSTPQEEIREQRDGRADIHAPGVLHVRGIQTRRLDSPGEEEVE